MTDQTDTQSDKATHSPDPYDKVRCNLFCYDVIWANDHESKLSIIWSVKVGPKGIRLPLDADMLAELPIQLIRIYELDGTTAAIEPKPGTMYQIEMERHLAIRKRFQING